MRLLENTTDIFEIRKKDIKLYFEVLKNPELNFTTHESSILRSTVTLLLYNIIEAVVVKLFEDYYSAIGQREYSQLPEALQELWLDFRLRKNDPHSANHQTYVNTSKDIIRLISNNQLISLPSRKVRAIMSGNADHKSIQSLFDKHGIRVSNSPIMPVLKGIKDDRNDLGHGSKTFEEVGREKTIQVLENEKNAVMTFLQELIATIACEIINIEDEAIAP